MQGQQLITKERCFPKWVNTDLFHEEESEAKALEGVCVCLFIYGDGIGGTGRTEPRSSEPYEWGKTTSVTEVKLWTYHHPSGASAAPDSIPCNGFDRFEDVKQKYQPVGSSFLMSYSNIPETVIILWYKTSFFSILHKVDASMKWV